MARFTTLYSGSTGNCAVLEHEGRFLLIDMGRSCRQTEQAIAQLGLQAEHLCGVLLTHEHSDHINGLSVFLKKRAVPIYGCGPSLAVLQRAGVLSKAALCIDVQGTAQGVAGFWVESFPTYHDAVASCGYRITAPDKTVLAFATDLGVISPEVWQAMQGAHLVALEANYDRYLLMSGSYPSALKYRIDSNHGHLSNTDSVKCAVRLLQQGCKKLVLCHLSKENNRPDLVLRELHEEAQRVGLAMNEHIFVRIASREMPDAWVDL